MIFIEGLRNVPTAFFDAGVPLLLRSMDPALEERGAHLRRQSVRLPAAPASRSG